jgi:hypothetical protein
MPSNHLICHSIQGCIQLTKHHLLVDFSASGPKNSKPHPAFAFLLFCFAGKLALYTG